jgi:hypothetical protein
MAFCKPEFIIIELNYFEGSASEFKIVIYTTSV